MDRSTFIRRYPCKNLNQNTKAIIAFHQDNDGSAAARIAYNYLKDCGYAPDTIWPFMFKTPRDCMRAIAGGVSACENITRLIIVDLAIMSPEGFSILEDICSLPSMTVDYIDHHASTEKALMAFRRLHMDQVPNCYKNVTINTELAACALTWDRFYHDTAMLRVVQLIADHDIYKNEVENSAEFFKGSLKYDFGRIKSGDIWDKLESDNTFIDSIIEDGKVIVHYERSILYPQIMRSARKFILTLKSKDTKSGCHFGNCIVVNTPIGNCELFDNASDYDFMVKEHINFKGEWNYTIYSNRYDTTLITEQFGGGGHRGISGFTSSEQIFKVVDGIVNIDINGENFGSLFNEAPIKF